MLVDSGSIYFTDDVSAVFSTEVSYASDPIGLGLSGKVKLLSAANSKGKQSTLAKGKFYGSFGRDEDGDLELGGADKDTVVSSGTVIVAGAARSLSDANGNPDAPPAIQYGVMGNGSGTKNASTQTSTRPQLV